MQGLLHSAIITKYCPFVVYILFVTLSRWQHYYILWRYWHGIRWMVSVMRPVIAISLQQCTPPNWAQSTARHSPELLLLLLLLSERTHKLHADGITHIHIKHWEQEIIHTCTMWCEAGAVQSPSYLKMKTTQIWIIVIVNYYLQCN